jgi:hypothetical protein
VEIARALQNEDNELFSTPWLSSENRPAKGISKSPDPIIFYQGIILEPQYTLKTAGRHLSSRTITLAVILPIARISMRNL